MNKGLICLLLSLMLVCCGCKSTDPNDYTSAPIYHFTDNVPFYGDLPGVSEIGRYPVEYSPEKYEKYLTMVDDSYIGVGFIHYEDISFIGEYYIYWQAHKFGKPETMHTNQSFGFVDDSGIIRRIDINRVPQPELDVEKYRKMPDVVNYFCVPRPVDVDIDNRFFSYTANGMVYRYYLNYYRESEEYKYSENKLASVTWTYLDCTITVYTWNQEITEDCGFIYDLMVPERAESAKDKFNNAILKAYIGNYLEIWAPVYIPVLCVAAAGTVYLIIRRKRKKAAVKSAVQETEQKTEN